MWESQFYKQGRLWQMLFCVQYILTHACHNTISPLGHINPTNYRTETLNTHHNFLTAKNISSCFCTTSCGTLIARVCKIFCKLRTFLITGESLVVSRRGVQKVWWHSLRVLINVLKLEHLHSSESNVLIL